MSTFYDGNLARQLEYPIEHIGNTSVRRFVRRRKISGFRLCFFAVIIPIIVGFAGLCYTAKCSEMAETSYQLSQLKNELEVLKDETSRLEISILTSKSEIQLGSAVAAGIAMHSPSVTDVSVVQ